MTATATATSHKKSKLNFSYLTLDHLREKRIDEYLQEIVTLFEVSGKTLRSHRKKLKQRLREIIRKRNHYFLKVRDESEEGSPLIAVGRMILDTDLQFDKFAIIKDIVVHKDYKDFGLPQEIQHHLLLTAKSLGSRVIDCEVVGSVRLAGREVSYKRIRI